MLCIRASSMDGPGVTLEVDGTRYKSLSRPHDHGEFSQCKIRQNARPGKRARHAKRQTSSP